MKTQILPIRIYVFKIGAQTQIYNISRELVYNELATDKSIELPIGMYLI